jgi:F-type H+-transporting ATPase subunit gamma
LGRSQRELRNRIKSVESTMHITRAMELVSSSKFKKAFDTFEKGRCYFDLLNETFEEISDYVKESPFFTERGNDKKIVIVISGDRGLVGGFNNNLYKLADDSIKIEGEHKIIPFGKKAVEHYKNYPITELREGFEICDKITPEKIKELSVELSKRFLKGEIHEVYVVYTKYLTMLSQEAECQRLLPVTRKNNDTKAESEADTKSRQMTFEPSADGVLLSAVPEYVSGMIYGALCESIVSENAARRMAMDSATKNAGEIIDSLTLEYNRARQGAITQEITEIVAGSEK